MQRRKFLGAVGIGLGATTLPMWLSRAFNLGGEVCREPAGSPAIAGLESTPMEVCEDVARPALDSPPACDPPASAAVGKPQLVLVIPEAVEHQYDRGTAFGELLNHGSDEQLALFAPFEVVCRRVSELGPAAQQAGRTEPLMIVVDVAGGRPPLALDAPLPPHLESRSPWMNAEEPRGGEPFEVREDRRIQERIDLLAKLLAQATTLERLAPQARAELAALPCEQRVRLEEAPLQLTTFTASDLDALAATTLLTARVHADAGDRGRLHATLAAAVRGRLTNTPIPGAPWARSGGCGTVVEGDEGRSGGMACGMGHVPERSRRFLMFYANRW